MKSRAILFSTEMVRAILAGEKTQTRRIIPIPGELWAYEASTLDIHFNPLFMTLDFVSESGQSLCDIPFTYGEEDDLLWVKQEHKITSEHRPGFKCEHWTCEFADGSTQTWYAKDLSINTLLKLRKRKTIGKWQRARFLPKELSRIWLQITAMDIEKLNEIDEDDAIAEGIGYDATTYPPRLFNYSKNEWQTGGFPSVAYQQLWEKINGTGSWKENPWVWVIKFKVVSTTGKPVEAQEVASI